MEGSMANHSDPRVDAYLEKAAPFAREVLTHLRELMHTACPEVEETMKWSMPFFELNGVILGNMAAFKQHCSLGLWGPEMSAVLRADGFSDTDGMGKFGKLTGLHDLPSDKVMLGYFRQAAGFVLRGERTSSMAKPVKKVAKAAVEVPLELVAALKKNKAAAKVFADFSPSCKREYAEWIVEAKRAETKEKRVVQAVEWIAEGKSRHWKYKEC
jgi:uncharacterized protein YdeI (YjbR/CyaY-like superfamily)